MENLKLKDLVLFSTSFMWGLVIIHIFIDFITVGVIGLGDVLGAFLILWIGNKLGKNM